MTSQTLGPDLVYSQWVRVDGGGDFLGQKLSELEPQSVSADCIYAYNCCHGDGSVMMRFAKVDSLTCISRYFLGLHSFSVSASQSGVCVLKCVCVTFVK